MAIKTTNQLGSIVINDSVLAAIAGLAAVECAGIVGMSSLNAAEGIAELLKRESVTRGVKVTANNETVQIDLHVIIEYGVSMRAVAENVIDAVKYSIESLTGLRVDKVNVLIQGVRV